MIENEKKVPKRRFKEFENAEAWEQRKFGEIGTVQTCKRIFKEQTSESGDIPFYKNGTLGLKADAYISREVFEEYKELYSYPRVGDVLISVVGSIGRTAEYKGNAEYFQDSNIVWLKTDNNIIDKTFLKISYQIIDWLIEGSTIKHLYNDNILASKIWIPSSIDEQKAIGGFFDFLDNLITLQQRKLEKMKALKKAYLTDMFPADGERKPKLRFAGFTDNWEQRKLVEVAKYRNGKAHENSICENGSYVVVNSKFVSTDGEVRKYSNEQIEPLMKNEIAFVLSDVPNGRAIARTFLVQEVDKYTLNQRIAGITPNENTNPYFLHISINRHPYFLQFDDGVKQTNLSKSDVENFETFYPERLEQEKIGVFFSEFDNLITLHQRKLEKLQNIKKAYLNEMFI
ncbi:MAG: restriction endonuclease subunit S [Clostridium botulinum]|nr:restriction endonuclease subunit S [Clostridium botulinum]